MHTKLFLIHSSTCSDAVAVAPKDGQHYSLHIPFKIIECTCSCSCFRFEQPRGRRVTKSFEPAEVKGWSIGQIRRRMATKYALALKDGEVTND